MTDAHIKAEFDRAFEYARKWGPPRRAAEAIVDAAGLISHRIECGQTGFIELDIKRLEDAIKALRCALNSTDGRNNNKEGKE